MNHKSRTIFIFMACLIAATKPDQNLDCRKLVYSRNCRGVAIKRGYFENDDTQSAIALDTNSLRGLLSRINPPVETPSLEDLPTSKKVNIREERPETEEQKTKVHPNHILSALIMGSKRKNNENEIVPFYEY